MIVVDDIGHPSAVTVDELTAKRRPAPLPAISLTFVGAQLVQIAQIVGKSFASSLNVQSVEALDTYSLVRASNANAARCSRSCIPRMWNRSTRRSRRSSATSARPASARSLSAARSFASRPPSRPRKTRRRIAPVVLRQIDDLRVLNANDTEIQAASDRRPRLTIARILTELKKPPSDVCTSGRLNRPASLRPWVAWSKSSFRPSRSRLSCQTTPLQTRDVLPAGQRTSGLRRGGKPFAELFTKSEAPRDIKYDILFAEAAPSRRLGRFGQACPDRDPGRARTGQTDHRNGFRLGRASQGARADWMATLSPKIRADLEAARWAHFVRHQAWPSTNASSASWSSRRIDPASDPAACWKSCPTPNTTCSNTPAARRLAARPVCWEPR